MASRSSVLYSERNNCLWRVGNEEIFTTYHCSRNTLLSVPAILLPHPYFYPTVGLANRSTILPSDLVSLFIYLIPLLYHNSALHWLSLDLSLAPAAIGLKTIYARANRSK